MTLVQPRQVWRAAVSLGISMVRQRTDDWFAGKAGSAFERIHAVPPTDLQGELRQITTCSGPGQPVLSRAVSFSGLRGCIRRRRKVLIASCDGLGRESSRTVRPLALIFFSPLWVLAGWCERRNDFRSFRPDRIRSVQFGEDTVDDEKDKSLSAYRLQNQRC